MQSAQRLPKLGVIETLLEQPHRFEFFQAVRLLQLHLRQQEQINANDVLNEHLSFASTLSLSFPKSEIESLEKSESKYLLIPTMVGLTGNLGALPLVYSQKLVSNSWAKKSGSLAFLNLFNNRLISLFYQASIKHNLPLQAELNQHKSYLHCIHALEGYVPYKKDTNNDLLNQSMAEFAGLIQGQVLNVESIQQILRSFLNQTVQVHQFIESWFSIPVEQRSHLSAKGGLQLGVNSFCGERVKQIDAKIKLEIGPLDYDAYRSLLPSGQVYPRLKSLLQRICNPTLMIEMVLVLDKEKINPIQLDQKTETGLGGGAFLMSRSFEQHQSQTRFLLQ